MLELPAWFLPSHRSFHHRLQHVSRAAARLGQCGRLRGRLPTWSVGGRVKALHQVRPWQCLPWWYGTLLGMWPDGPTGPGLGGLHALRPSAGSDSGERLHLFNMRQRHFLLERVQDLRV